MPRSSSATPIRADLVGDLPRRSDAVKCMRLLIAGRCGAPAPAVRHHHAADGEGMLRAALPVWALRAVESPEGMASTSPRARCCRSRRSPTSRWRIRGGARRGALGPRDPAMARRRSDSSAAPCRTVCRRRAGRSSPRAPWPSRSRRLTRASTSGRADAVADLRLELRSCSAGGWPLSHFRCTATDGGNGRPPRGQAAAVTRSSRSRGRRASRATPGR